MEANMFFVFVGEHAYLKTLAFGLQGTFMQPQKYQKNLWIFQNLKFVVRIWLVYLENASFFTISTSLSLHEVHCKELT